MTVLVFLVQPQSRDPACLAMLRHSFGSMRSSASSGNDDIGATGIAFRVAGFAGKLDADLPKLRQALHSGSAWDGYFAYWYRYCLREWPCAPILTLHRALAATAADSQCENRIGSGGLDNRLLVAPPKMNSRHFACP